MEDHEIIDLFFARNERAVLETEKKYGTYCMAVSQGILSDRMDAEECVNDTWRWAWDHIPPTIPEKLRLYLGRVVRHLSLDRYRYNHAARRNKDLEVSFEELEECIPAPDGLPERDADVLRGHIGQFLREETQKARMVFLLRYYYGKSLADISEATGMSVKAVSKHLVRTRERLRVYLNERGYGV